MTPGGTAFGRPLEILEHVSAINKLDETLALIDALLNLLSKADAAIQRGEPGDRARALTLLDRAESRLPDDETDIHEDHRDGLRQAHATIRSLREIALALPE